MNSSIQRKGIVCRVLSICLICAVLSGCSGYRAASLPGVMHTSAEEEPRADLMVGQTARITQKSGLEVTGEIVSISAEAITIGNPGNYGFEKTAIPVDSIETIEVQQAGKTESSVMGVLMIGAAAAAVFFLLMSNALSGLGTT